MVQSTSIELRINDESERAKTNREQRTRKKYENRHNPSYEVPTAVLIETKSRNGVLSSRARSAGAMRSISAVRSYLCRRARWAGYDYMVVDSKTNGTSTTRIAMVQLLAECAPERERCNSDET